MQDYKQGIIKTETWRAVDAKRVWGGFLWHNNIVGPFDTILKTFFS